MYKVFFKERVIFLSDKTDNQFLSDQIHIFTKLKSFYNVLDDFFINNNNNNLLIVSDDVDKLLRKFVKYFVYIEAAGGFVENKNKQFLAIHRLGKWDLPKGVIENKESPSYAALREVEEECGISNIDLVSETESSFHIYSLNSKLILKRTYWFIMKYTGNEVLVPQAIEDIDRAEWLGVEQKKMFFNDTYLSIQNLLKNPKLEF